MLTTSISQNTQKNALFFSVTTGGTYSYRLAL